MGAALLMAASTSADPVLGQNAEDSVRVILDEIQVSAIASGPVRYVELRSPQHVGGGDLAAALSGELGLFVYRRNPGGPATPRIRGWDGSQVAVVLEGVRLIEPQSGQVDLSMIPAAFLERARLVRSTATDQGAMGGQVDMTLLQASDGLMVRLAGGGGAFGARHGAVVLGGDRRRAGVTLGLHASRAPESWPLAENRRRIGAGRERQSAVATLNWRTGTARWTISHLSSHADTALPGPANGRPLRASQEDRLGVTALGASGVRERTLWRAQAVWQTSGATFRDADANLDRSSQTSRASLTATFGRERWDLQGGVDTQYLKGGPETETGGFVDISTRQPTSRLVIFAGLRQEVRTARYRAVPRVSVSTRGSGLLVSVSAGRSVRHPTFVERYWQPGGNPDLRPEVGYTVDAGLESRLGALVLKTTAFAAWLDNRIVWQPSLVMSGLQVWTPTNVGRARSTGLEWRALWAGNRVAVGIDGSYTRATDRSDSRSASFGHQLRYVPRTVIAVPVRWAVGAVELSASARYTGHRPIASDGSFEEPPYTELDLALRTTRRLAQADATLSIMLHNALDIPFETVRLYPMPGRHLTLHLNIDLSS
ncbi:MAG: TonB-dependent receptor [Rhodothermales bacterium]|nr:TonB-dependent receptor [Rhodothermales bacterium]MBO6778889.1 TonB-dependent receptor [Rhodothermales bacterium]